MAHMLIRRTPETRRELHKNGTDRGSALVMAAIVSVVVFALAAALLSFANHQSSASNNDRQRQQSIDAAMAGLAVADAALTKDQNYLGTNNTAPVTFPGGGASYKVTVGPDTTPGASSYARIVTSWGYAPETNTKATRMVVQSVVLDPVVTGGFKYAVFTTADFTTSSSVIAAGSGGIFSDGTIDLKGVGATYSGDVTTTGDLKTGTNQTITGTFRNNGTLTIGPGTNLIGDILASNGNVLIGVGGKITGNVQAGGSVTGGPGGGTTNCANPLVTGTCIRWTAVSPSVARLVQASDFYTWNAQNYSPLPTNMTGAAFVAGVIAPTPSYTQGVFNLSGNISFVSGSVLHLTGDLTIHSLDSTTILPRRVVNDAGHPVQFNVIIERGGGITAPSFTVDPTVTTLIYGGNAAAISINTDAAVPAGTDRPMTGVVYNNQGAAITFGANSPLTFAPVTAPGFKFPPGSGVMSSTSVVHSISTREFNN